MSSKVKVSLITPSFGDRAPLLIRAAQQCPWVQAYEWIVAGPAELAEVCRQIGAKHVVTDAPLGTARNLACEACQGDIIVHLDDDDWQAHDRVARQVRALTAAIPGKGVRPEMVGSSWIYCLDVERQVASRISWWDIAHRFPGATLAYWRLAWRAYPFPDVTHEDGPFVTKFIERGTAFDMCDPKLLVYIRCHGRHLPLAGVDDWWRESRDRTTRERSALDTMRERIRRPSAPLPLISVPTDREKALAHEEEAATVYVRWWMGDVDFAWFCGKLDVARPL